MGGQVLSADSYHTQCSRSSSLPADTIYLPRLYICRDLLSFSSVLSLPFFIQPNSSTCRSHLRIISSNNPSKPSRLGYGLTPALHDCHLPPNDGGICASISHKSCSLIDRMCGPLSSAYTNSQYREGAQYLLNRTKLLIFIN